MSGPSSPAGGGPVVETTERFGLPFRHFQVAISAGTQALAWARQEDAPEGATVVADLEVSPLGRRGVLWHGRPETTLACAMVLRPAVSAEEGDVAWLLGALAALEAAEVTAGRSLTAWWPDKVVDAESHEPVAITKAEIQLGPGKVRSAVVTLRFDLQRLGLGADRRDELLEAAVASLHSASESLGDEDGAAAVATRYSQRCALVGRRVKIRIMPKGEVRGVVGAVDTTARLVLTSPTDLVERVTIDMVSDLQVV
jgi:BirA family transcriptional regulator, biotin operon repressor / biotin---[acetyl-CoA-carboxylase] ligase